MTIKSNALTKAMLLWLPTQIRTALYTKAMYNLAKHNPTIEDLTMDTFQQIPTLINTIESKYSDWKFDEIEFIASVKTYALTGKSLPTKTNYGLLSKFVANSILNQLRKENTRALKTDKLALNFDTYTNPVEVEIEQEEKQVQEVKAIAATNEFVEHLAKLTPAQKMYILKINEIGTFSDKEVEGIYFTRGQHKGATYKINKQVRETLGINYSMGSARSWKHMILNMDYDTLKAALSKGKAIKEYKELDQE